MLMCSIYLTAYVSREAEPRGRNVVFEVVAAAVAILLLPPLFGAKVVVLSLSLFLPGRLRAGSSPIKSTRRRRRRQPAEGAPRAGKKGLLAGALGAADEPAGCERQEPSESRPRVAPEGGRRRWIVNKMLIHAHV